MFVLRAPAKVNLGLKVQSEREDGYLDLFHVAMFLDICDFITIKETKKETPIVRFSGKYSNKLGMNSTFFLKNNTVDAAIEFMHEKFRSPMNFEICIEKMIPVAGGLGGSATDAGTIINFLCQHLDVNIPSSDILELSKKVGADAPFMCQSNAAICKGTGDIVKKISFTETVKPLPIVIVCPNFSLNTETVFTAMKEINKFHPLSDSEIKKWEDRISSAIDDFESFVVDVTKIGNDLLDAATKIRPEIGEIVEYLSSFEGVLGANMSGSGSCCFAVCKTDEDAIKVRQEAQSKFKLYEVFLSKLLPYFQRERILPTAKPAMEMIFFSEDARDGEEFDWKKIK